MGWVLSTSCFNVYAFCSSTQVCTIVYQLHVFFFFTCFLPLSLPVSCLFLVGLPHAVNSPPPLYNLAPRIDIYYFCNFEQSSFDISLPHAIIWTKDFQHFLKPIHHRTAMAVSWMDDQALKTETCSSYVTRNFLAVFCTLGF